MIGHTPDGQINGRCFITSTSVDFNLNLIDCLYLFAVFLSLRNQSKALRIDERVKLATKHLAAFTFEMR